MNSTQFIFFNRCCCNIFVSILFSVESMFKWIVVLPCPWCQLSNIRAYNIAPQSCRDLCCCLIFYLALKIKCTQWSTDTLSRWGMTVWTISLAGPNIPKSLHRFLRIHVLSPCLLSEGQIFMAVLNINLIRLLRLHTCWILGAFSNLRPDENIDKNNSCICTFGQQDEQSFGW